MTNVTVRTKNPNYMGRIYGYSFYNGESQNVPVKHAEFMERQFEVEIDKPKPKRRTRAKTTTKAKPKAKPKAKAEKKAD